MDNLNSNFFKTFDLFDPFPITPDEFMKAYEPIKSAGSRELLLMCYEAIYGEYPYDSGKLETRRSLEIEPVVLIKKKKKCNSNTN